MDVPSPWILQLQYSAILSWTLQAAPKINPQNHNQNQGYTQNQNWNHAEATSNSHQSKQQNQKLESEANQNQKYTMHAIVWKRHVPRDDKILDLKCGNDPSAGSPTETLLRLHLPLNDKV
jgi:hypothetical protein